ncbi:MAG: flavodoxin family protein [Rhodospirillales bacterium]|nr:flavodoxin family protein [Rhodospirillales bacterium]
MKVVAVNGSARENGNTRILIDTVRAELEQEGIETEVFELAGRDIHGCRVCAECSTGPDPECGMDDDDLNEILPGLLEADGMILGSPVYFSDVTPEMKALIDRAGRVNRAGRHLLRRKPAAGVVAVRRAGAMHTFDSLNHFFQINEMIVVGSSYWNIGIGHAKGDVENDTEGLRTMKTLGANMAWLMKRLNG